MKTIWALPLIIWFVFIHGADVENLGREESISKVSANR